MDSKIILFVGLISLLFLSIDAHKHKRIGEGNHFRHKGDNKCVHEILITTQEGVQKTVIYDLSQIEVSEGLQAYHFNNYYINLCGTLEDRYDNNGSIIDCDGFVCARKGDSWEVLADYYEVEAPDSLEFYVIFYLKGEKDIMELNISDMWGTLDVQWESFQLTSMPVSALDFHAMVSEDSMHLIFATSPYAYSDEYEVDFENDDEDDDDKGHGSEGHESDDDDSESEGGYESDHDCDMDDEDTEDNGQFNNESAGSGWRDDDEGDYSDHGDSSFEMMVHALIFCIGFIIVVKVVRICCMRRKSKTQATETAVPVTPENSNQTQEELIQIPIVAYHPSFYPATEAPVSADIAQPAAEGTAQQPVQYQFYPMYPAQYLQGNQIVPNN